MPQTSNIRLADRTIHRESFPYGDFSSRYGKPTPATAPLYSSDTRESCELRALWRLLQLRCFHSGHLISHRIHDDTENCLISLVYEVTRT